MPDSPSRPPVAVEQWVDLIVASAAHRSHNPGQQAFGQALLQRYFVALPERYRDDKVALQYFDNMLCVVAAGVRGFSVVRDVFQTNWDALKSERDAAVAYMERLRQFAPLQKDGYWSKALGAALGAGLATPLAAAFSKTVSPAPLLWILVGLGGAAAGVIAVQWIVEWLVRREQRRIESAYPQKLLDEWQQKSLRGYRTVIRQIVPLAIEVSDRFYPGGSAPLGEDKLDEVVERHFAFKLKPPAGSSKQPTSAVAQPSGAATADERDSPGDNKSK